MESTAFFAYPAVPVQLGETIERALTQLKAMKDCLAVTAWTALDIAGHFISDEVGIKVDETGFFVADITFLNFNVIYELGYAIGLGKRVYTVRNRSFQEVYPSAKDVGLFDNLGYREYTNSDELRGLLKGFTSENPLDISVGLNSKAPVYLLETKHKTDWISRVVSRVKKARYIFRNFDPNESPRLSAYEAINQVAQSYGVLVPLLSESQEGAAIHNLRAGFVAGLAAGLKRPLCIIQQGDGPIPLDVRDIAETAHRLDDINEIVGEFAARVAEAFQEGRSVPIRGRQTFLSTLDLGASSAENEMRTLQNYYLNTEAFLKSLRGEAHLVVGRKGSGKSAIFLQIRDRERSRDPSQNIVLDLKPEGYKLLKFKELILQFMQEGTLQHTITAFWNYVLLLEICYKILEKDKQRHLNNHNLYESYKRLEDLYNVSGYFSEGDFSERISSLIEKIHSRYEYKYGMREGVRLDSGQITELLYEHDLRKLENELAKYMQYKGVLWLLFDNVDKGWPTSGLKHEDLIIIRCLIDAARKIEREFSKVDVDVNTIVFLRNDVYELLVQETSDRGKEGNVMLDWTDQDLLREIIRLRIVANGLDDSMSIDEAWPLICVPLYHGEDSLQYLIDRSLMRPRFLLNLINQCKASAVNLKHEKIYEDDIEKGFATYSVDVLTDVEYEMNDVSPSSGDALYAFIDVQDAIAYDDVVSVLTRFGVRAERVDDLVNLLLWYGFLGVQVAPDDVRYIYDFNYSTRMLRGFLRARPNSVFSVNPAFSEALAIAM